MTFDFKTISDVVTLVIIVVSAVAALRQLKLNRSGNQLKAVLSIQHDFQEPALQAAFVTVQSSIASKLLEPEYRAVLTARGYIDPGAHPEVVVCNWFDGVGVTVKYELVSEDALMDLYGRLIAYYWDLISPAIALMRVTRGNTQYHNFEYLAIRARAWNAKHPEGIFPHAHRRPALVRTDVPESVGSLADGRREPVLP